MAARYYGGKKILEKAEMIGPATEQMVFVRNDEALVGIVTGSKYAIAAGLTDQKKYFTFYRACQKGEWTEMVLYRLSKEAALECPDQGRLPLEELPAENRKKQIKEI